MSKSEGARPPPHWDDLPPELQNLVMSHLRLPQFLPTEPPMLDDRAVKAARGASASMRASASSAIEGIATSRRHHASPTHLPRLPRLRSIRLVHTCEAGSEEEEDDEDEGRQLTRAAAADARLARLFDAVADAEISTLEILHCSGLTVGPAACASLASMLRDAQHLGNLKSLRLSCVHAAQGEEDVIVTALARALCAGTHLARLEELEIDCCHCSRGEPSAAAAAAGALATVFRDAKHLSRLRTLGRTLFSTRDGGRGTIDALAAATHLTALQRLDFSCMRLEQASWTALVEALGAPSSRHFGSLRELDLTAAVRDPYRYSPEDAIAAVARALGAATHLTNLATLSLGSNGMCAQAAGQLVRAVAGAPHLSGLVELDLCGNLLADAGVAELMRGLCAAKHVAALERVDLSYNEITAEGLHTVAAALAGESGGHLTSLRELGLRGNSFDREHDGRQLVDALLSLPPYFDLRIDL